MFVAHRLKVRLRSDGAKAIASSQSDVALLTAWRPGVPRAARSEKAGDAVWHQIAPASESNRRWASRQVPLVSLSNIFESTILGLPSEVRRTTTIG